MNNPCTKDCPDRSPTCHAKGNCKHGYDDFVEYREQIRKEKMKARMVTEYKINLFEGKERKK